MTTRPGLLLAFALAVSLAAAHPAAAQYGTSSPRYGEPGGPLYPTPGAIVQPRGVVIGPQQQMPDLAPWDRALRRFYERENVLRPKDPLARSEQSMRKLYQDPAKKLGLPAQASPDALRPGLAPPPPALPENVIGLDGNGDGRVTRREYLDRRFRARPVAPGPAAEARRRDVIGRARARFNGADTDRNGILNAGELRAVIDPRF